MVPELDVSINMIFTRLLSGFTIHLGLATPVIVIDIGVFLAHGEPVHH